MGNELSCCEGPGGQRMEARPAFAGIDRRQATANRAERLLPNAVMTRMGERGGHSGARMEPPGHNGPSSGSGMSWKQKPLGSFVTSRRFKSQDDMRTFLLQEVTNESCLLLRFAVHELDN